MRFLLAAVSAFLLLGLAAGGFLYLIDRYEQQHRDAILAEVTIDAAGHIRIDGQSIGWDQLRAVWRERDFRARHCGRWRLQVHPDAPSGLGQAVSRLIECR